MWEYMNGGMGFGMGLGMLLAWAAQIALVVVVVRAAMGSANSTRREHTALDILEERYARGEIGRKYIPNNSAYRLRWVLLYWGMLVGCSKSSVMLN